MFERASPGSANSGTLGISTKGPRSLRGRALHFRHLRLPENPAASSGPPSPPPLLSRLSTRKPSGPRSSSDASRRRVGRTRSGRSMGGLKRGLSEALLSYREIFRGRDGTLSLGRSIGRFVERRGVPASFVLRNFRANISTLRSAGLFPSLSLLRVFARVLFANRPINPDTSLSLSPLARSSPPFFFSSKNLRNEENRRGLIIVLIPLYPINVRVHPSSCPFLFLPVVLNAHASR